MLGAQRRIVDENPGGQVVQRPPSRARQRRIDTVSNERVDELESIRNRPQKRVAQQRFAGAALIADQRAEVGEGEALP